MLNSANQASANLTKPAVNPLTHRDKTKIAVTISQRALFSKPVESENASIPLSRVFYG